MKIMFIGTLISNSEMEILNSRSRIKASIAPVNFETSFVKSIASTFSDISILSVPAISSFPGGGFLFLKGKKERFSDSILISWIPIVNLQFLKQFFIYFGIQTRLKKWLQANKDISDKIVIIYSVYPPYSLPALKLCKKYNCHLTSIIPDLPEYMYTRSKQQGIKNLLKRRFSKEMISEQVRSDSYILLTRQMSTRMGIQMKPHLVIEGFSDTEIFDSIKHDKYSKKTITYAGALNDTYGIKTLVCAFMRIEGDYELHIYGYGEQSKFVESCSQLDPRIKHNGRVSRTDLLIALKKSHLLVINKPINDDYSSYSFSSKILEYMSSGTPVLMTKVLGLPLDYYPYVYFIENDSDSEIQNALWVNINRTQDELDKKGNMALQFVRKNKEYLHRSKEISEFLSDQVSSVGKNEI